MFNGTLQYLELKNLGSNSVNLTGWEIQNTKAANGSITLASGTIPASGYYLISNLSEAASILQVTPDLVEPALLLNTSSQSDIILRNATTVFDTIQSSPWPAGDSSTPKSMERKQNP
jgi:hypothetical protein